MTYEQNLEAILDTHLPVIKDEIKDSIIDSILRLKSTGRWIRKEQDDGVYCECSECGHRSLLEYDYTGFEDDPETWSMFDFNTVPLKNKNYCSNCGTKMEVE